jgi:hypothetical protein
MNCRRLMLVPNGQRTIVTAQAGLLEGVSPAVRRRSPTVRFSFHCGHPAALPRTAASGQQETPALQKKAPLFDHLVGAGEEGIRDDQTERLGGGQVHHEIELGRLLDWDVGCLRPTQNLIDHLGYAPE